MSINFIVSSQKPLLLLLDPVTEKKDTIVSQQARFVLPFWMGLQRRRSRRKIEKLRIKAVRILYVLMQESTVSSVSQFSIVSATVITDH